MVVVVVVVVVVVGGGTLNNCFLFFYPQPVNGPPSQEQPDLKFSNFSVIIFYAMSDSEHKCVMTKNLHPNGMGGQKCISQDPARHSRLIGYFMHMLGYSYAQSVDTGI